jgi:hypothetical protein
VSATENEAVDEAALEGDERHRQRRHDKKRARGQHAPFLAALGAHREGSQTDGQRLIAGTVDHHQRP